MDYLRKILIPAHVTLHRYHVDGRSHSPELPSEARVRIRARVGTARFRHQKNLATLSTGDQQNVKLNL